MCQRFYLTGAPVKEPERCYWFKANSIAYEMNLQINSKLAFSTREGRGGENQLSLY